MLNDLNNAATVAKEFGVPLPMSRAAMELYRMLDAQGKGGMDPVALIELLNASK